MKALFGSGCAFSPSPSVLFFSSFHLFFFTFPPVPSFLVESFFAPVPGSFLRLAPSHLTLRSFKFQLFVSLSPLLPLPKRTLLSILSLGQQLIISLLSRLHLSLFHYSTIGTSCIGLAQAVFLNPVVARGQNARPLKNSVPGRIRNLRTLPILWTRTNEVPCTE